ncbi:MAG: Hsp20/alpha crystallin family protein [Verrucomicrobia bacterium]|nr:Hsp20/alpha crystallin family protein [Verrucomicrobiota bacterium]
MSRKIRTLRLRLIEDQLGELAYQITKVHFAQFQDSAAEWQPHVNVFQCANCVRICVELAGVEEGNVEIEVHRGRVRIQGYREAPEPLRQQEATFSTAPKPVRVIAMEIDHGGFSREVEIPAGYDYRRVTTKWENGLVWICIPRVANA